MNPYYKGIFFMKSFVTGLFLPILTLLILGKGVSLTALPLIMGIYSFVAVLLEFPSGVACDLYGRKNTFLLSEILMVLSYIALALAGNEVFLAIAMGVQGCARAFSSGSLDALVIEISLKHHGESECARVNSQLGLLESLGIASGSILSGLFAMICQGYLVNLLIAIFAHILILILTVYKVQEEHHTCEETEIGKKAGQFFGLMKNSIRTVVSSRELRLLTGVLFITGLVLMPVETYWQTFFHGITGSLGEWILGIVGFIGFSATALGSVSVQKILVKKSRPFWWKVFFFTKLFFGISLFLLGFQRSPHLFVLGYGLVYLTLGAASVSENTLLAACVVNKNRAGIMSLTSLVFQLGALVSSALCSAAMRMISISMLWCLCGIVFMAIVIWAFAASWKLLARFLQHAL